jgi:hypothetical protein
MDEIKRELVEKLSVSVPRAGQALAGLGRNASYEAAQRGDIPTIRIGKRLAVPTSWLRQKLGISEGQQAQA